MRLGVVILPDGKWRDRITQWRAAEELGLNSGWTYDHYWWRPLAGNPWFSALPLLTAAACATKNIELGTLVASPNFRHPVVLAKEAATIDDISGGRLTLGIGSGSVSAGDVHVLGRDTLSGRERAERFREFVEVVDALTRGDATDHLGRYYAAVDAKVSLGDGRRPRPAIAVAATGRRGFDLASARGDAWVTLGPPDLTKPYTPTDCLAAVTEQVQMLENACRRRDRDPADIRRIYVSSDITGDLYTTRDRFLRTVESYGRAGITDFLVHWPRADWPYKGEAVKFGQIVEKSLLNVRDL
jgi:alkanesulfonate monooxygenase SsuD/methylene tetrahydromethanopterin reductase-like flavin-dependent oxidoreductase (luciferase family)